MSGLNLTVRGYWSGNVVLVNMPRGGQKCFLVNSFAPQMKTPTYVNFTDEGTVITTCGTGELLEILQVEDYPYDYGKL